MKVLVTGGSGFIGSHVADKLVDLGHSPVIYDRYRHKISRHESILGDIRDATSVTEAIAHVDAVMHLAGVLGTQETIQNPSPAAETNVLGGLNIFKAIHQYGLPAVYIAVGNHWMLNTYSISKTAVEKFALMFNAEHGTHIAVVRALNAYGPRQVPVSPWGSSKVRKIMPSFICRAVDNLPIEIYGDGEQVMDMIYVEDVAMILCKALFDDHGVYDKVFEAGTGRATTVKQIAGAVINEVGSGSVEHLPMRPGEPDHSIVLGDPSSLTPLGIIPEDLTPLELGLKPTVEYFKELLFRNSHLLEKD